MQGTAARNLPGCTGFKLRSSRQQASPSLPLAMTQLKEGDCASFLFKGVHSVWRAYLLRKGKAGMRWKGTGQVAAFAERGLKNQEPVKACQKLSHGHRRIGLLPPCDFHSLVRSDHQTLALNPSFLINTPPPPHMITPPPIPSTPPGGKEHPAPPVRSAPSPSLAP